jgi:hypothetical protein
MVDTRRTATGGSSNQNTNANPPPPAPQPPSMETLMAMQTLLMQQMAQTMAVMQ